MRMGADLALSHDPATFVAGGMAPLGLTYTPTNDPGPEFILDVDSQAGTITSGSHTLSLPATHLIAAFMDFTAPLDGDPPSPSRSRVTRRRSASKPTSGASTSWTSASEGR